MSRHSNKTRRSAHDRIPRSSNDDLAAGRTRRPAPHRRPAGAEIPAQDRRAGHIRRPPVRLRHRRHQRRPPVHAVRPAPAHPARGGDHRLLAALRRRTRIVPRRPHRRPARPSPAHRRARRHLLRRSARLRVRTVDRRDDRRPVRARPRRGRRLRRRPDVPRRALPRRTPRTHRDPERADDRLGPAGGVRRERRARRCDPRARGRVALDAGGRVAARRRAVLRDARRARESALADSARPFRRGRRRVAPHPRRGAGRAGGRRECRGSDASSSSGSASRWCSS